jgi:CheY-like chemotaxis protein
MALRVLVAEDEALVAYLLSDILEGEGYDVEITFNGVEALAAARKAGPLLDVLVTDLNMPRMSGDDLIRLVRTERPSLPVIVLTASPPHGGLAELRSYGGGDGPMTLLIKPILTDALLAALKDATRLRVDAEAGRAALS